MAKLISTYTVTEKLVSDSGTLPRSGTPPTASTWNVSISDTNNQAITVTGTTFKVDYPTVMVKRTNNVGEKNYAAANFGAQLLNPRSSSLWNLHLRRPNEKEYTWSSKMTQGTDIQVYRNYDVSGAQIVLNTGDFFNGTNNRSRTVQLTWATILGSPGGTGDVTSSGLWSKYSKDGYTAYFAAPSSAVTKSWNVTLTLNAPPSINSVSQSYSGPRTNGTSGNYYAKHTAYIINYSAGASYGGFITNATLSLGSYSASKTNTASGQLVVTPTSAGTFTPTLTVTDSRGQTTTRTFTSVTYVNPGVPSITASNATSSFPKDGFLKGLATASSTVTATSGINGGTIKTVKLEVGSYSGSRIGNGTVTTSVLNTAGSFTPKVTVTDNYGYSSSKNLAAITVINPPGPTFTAGNTTSSTTNGFWKGYSKVSSVISSAKSGISDGTIKTITISAGGQSGSLSNVTSGTVITSGRVNVSGSVTPSVTVTDNRGYSTTKNLSSVTFNIPTIAASKVNVERLNRDTHKPDDAGLDALITATINRQAIDEGTTNFASIFQPDIRIGTNSSPSSITWYESYDKSAGTFTSAINWDAYNPSANAITIYGFATYSDDVYVKTQDELIDSSKTYYTVDNKVYTAVEEPVVEDIKSYYEKTSGFKPDEAYSIAVRPKMGQVGTSTVITGAYTGDTLAPAFYLLAGLAGGRGLAIGRKAYDETFRVAMPTHFEEVVTFENASAIHLAAKTAYETRPFMSVYDDGDTDSFGQMVRIGAGSKTIIGAGESAIDYITRPTGAMEGMLPNNVIPTDSNENLYLVADGEIHFYTGSTNDGSSYSKSYLTTGGLFFTEGSSTTGYNTLLLCKDASVGGWARDPFRIFGKTTSDHIASIGAFGSGNTFNYLYIGSNAYNGNNLRVYPDGHIWVNTIEIQKPTMERNTYADTNPKLIFKNTDGSQSGSLTWTDFDSIQAPASLTLNGNQGGEYFIAPNIRTTSGIHMNNNTWLNGYLTSGADRPICGINASNDMFFGYGSFRDKANSVYFDGNVVHVRSNGAINFNNYLTVTANGKNSYFGCQNASFCHIYTDAANLAVNKTIAMMDKAGLGTSTYPVGSIYMSTDRCVETHMTFRNNMQIRLNSGTGSTYRWSYIMADTASNTSNIYYKADGYHAFYCGTRSANTTGRCYLEYDGLTHQGWGRFAGTTTTTSSANARIGTASPVGRIYYNASSSERYKHDIIDLTNDDLLPEKLYDLKVRQFKYNYAYLDENDVRSNEDVPGFIAEELFELYPIAVDLDDYGRPDDWNDRYIIPPMLALIQQQKKEIDTLTEKVSELERRLA